MRVWILPIAAVVTFTLGCNKSPEGGTPGTHATVKVSLPTTSQDVKQGEPRTIEGSLDRGSDFKSDVTLKVEAPPKVEIKLSKDTIKASDSDTKFTMTVTPAKDAAIGDQVVKVTATPAAGGKATTGEFKVKVTDK